MMCKARRGAIEDAMDRFVGLLSKKIDCDDWGCVLIGAHIGECGEPCCTPFDTAVKRWCRFCLIVCRSMQRPRLFVSNLRFTNYDMFLIRSATGPWNCFVLAWKTRGCPYGSPPRSLVCWRRPSTLTTVRTDCFFVPLHRRRSRATGSVTPHLQWN